MKLYEWFNGLFEDETQSSKEFSKWANETRIEFEENRRSREVYKNKKEEWEKRFNDRF